eukprot:5377827-Heterocapsa_arctica.AAC.1
MAAAAERLAAMLDNLNADAAHIFEEAELGSLLVDLRRVLQIMIHNTLLLKLVIGCRQPHGGTGALQRSRLIYNRRQGGKGDLWRTWGHGWASAPSPG